ncbi:MAG: hypothetical protein HY673_14325 [Chloroflexi bacterium]|nr:hypothetical protein [Chloroflexota bacterium]
MTTGYRETWAELGIDMERHDRLLTPLGPVYNEIYLSQKDRPQGMGFYDFVVGDIHGIRVHELREHARNGGKVVATHCVFVPDEITLAAGAIPVGLCAGAQFSAPFAEDVLPPQNLPAHQVLLRIQARTPLPLCPEQPPHRRRDHLGKKGIPLLCIESDYWDDSGQLLTRIEAFLEMMTDNCSRRSSACGGGA